MADVESENFPRMYVWIALSIFACVFIQIISYFISKLSKKQESETPEEIAESEDTKPVRNVAAKPEAKASKPSKKRAWKGGKSEFTHPWLLKGLKGHTGAILDMDFSSNGKFLATSCEEPVAMDAVISPAAERARARKPRERRRAPTPPPPAPPAPSPRLPLPLLEAYLRLHLLPPERIWALGYPVECGASPLQAVFYIGRPPRTRAFTALDARAPSPGDSGRGSRGSSSRSDSDEEAAAPDAREHNCARCEARFRISADGEYLTRERCFYHWGRAGPGGAYACCGACAGARGCETGRLHVWSGTHEGMNGPREGYVRARARRGGVLALDAEMVYTTGGLELASVAVVGPDGRLVYRATVRPQRPVIDCNTRFSGVRPRDIERATKTLRDVQSDILGFVGADTILVGHALDNDLRALRLIHGAVIDTSALFPHRRGLPWRRSLRALAAEQLGRSVQNGAHQPAEDAHTALDLVLARARSDLAVA